LGGDRVGDSFDVVGTTFEESDKRCFLSQLRLRDAYCGLADNVRVFNYALHDSDLLLPGPSHHNVFRCNFQPFLQARLFPGCHRNLRSPRLQCYPADAENGIRIALGAQRSDVIGLIIKHGMRLVAVGLVIGLAAALACGRVVKTFLFEIKPFDAITFICVPILLSVAALLACYLPARRATRVDPLRSLRHE
jgi:hypothetical protein